VRGNEEVDLFFMREEEKLARDVYLSLFEAGGLRILRNIARAGSVHMTSASTVIEKYELDDPVAVNGLGVFSNADLQTLYEELAALGTSSVESALLVGAAIEDVDIFDLKQGLARTNNEDLAVL
jgi:hypothetical protein